MINYLSKMICGNDMVNNDEMERLKLSIENDIAKFVQEKFEQYLRKTGKVPRDVYLNVVPLKIIGFAKPAYRVIGCKIIE